jgi:antirestriction protein ArdC
MSKVDIYQEVTDSIIAELEAGTVPWRKPWTFTGEANAHRNYGTRRPYRGVNVWLLEMVAQRCQYEFPYWLTYKQADKMGGNVRKGEKSTLVVFWKMNRYRDKNDPDKTVTIPMLRYFRVFNIAQCEGLPEPEPITEPEDHDPIAAAQAIIDGMPNAPTITHDGRDSAHYVPAWDSVHLPKMATFATAEHYYHTAFHELGHSTGHESRLNRPIENGFGTPEYAKEELIAEMTAAMLCGQAGIFPPLVKHSAAYIANWLQALKDDRKLVVTAAGKAQKAADYIIGDAAEDHAEETESEQVAVAA